MTYPQKCVSLPARPGEPNDWLAFGNRDYAITTARCHWVRLWVIWSDIEPTPLPTDTATKYAAYNSKSFFSYLDQQIADANANGVAVLLSMSQYFPTWSNGATGPEPGTNKDPRTRFPSDLTTSSPWAAFLAYLYNRYRAHNYAGSGWGGIYNASGPNPANWHGNPLRAWISGLGIVNEPNFEAWQEYDPGCVAAQMMQTMDSMVSYWNSTAPAPTAACALFAPDIADHLQDYASDGTLKVTDYAHAVQATLEELQNWRPANYWVWSHHVYQDVKNGNNDRANQVRSLLYDYNWRGGGDRFIYCTEGGWRMGSYADATTQRDKFVNHWNLSRDADFRMGTQHLIRDTHPSTAMVDHATGTTYPLWGAFANLLPRR
jgi:hypothetical protein